MISRRKSKIILNETGENVKGCSRTSLMQQKTRTNDNEQKKNPRHKCLFFLDRFHIFQSDILNKTSKNEVKKITIKIQTVSQMHQQ